MGRKRKRRARDRRRIRELEAFSREVWYSYQDVVRDPRVHEVRALGLAKKYGVV